MPTTGWGQPITGPDETLLVLSGRTRRETLQQRFPVVMVTAPNSLPAPQGAQHFLWPYIWYVLLWAVKLSQLLICHPECVCVLGLGIRRAWIVRNGAGGGLFPRSVRGAGEQLAHQPRSPDRCCPGAQNSLTAPGWWWIRAGLRQAGC